MLVRRNCRSTVLGNSGVKGWPRTRKERLPMTAMNWSDDRVEQLKTLWTEGLSGQPDRPRPGRRYPQRRDRQGAPAGPGGARQPVAVGTPAPAHGAQGAQRTHPAAGPAGGGGGSADPGRRQPRHRPDHQRPHVPLAHRRPAASEFPFCGHSPKAGSPYCEAHARKAYQPQQARRAPDKGRMMGVRRDPAKPGQIGPVDRFERRTPRAWATGSFIRPAPSPSPQLSRVPRSPSPRF